MQESVGENIIQGSELLQPSVYLAGPEVFFPNSSQVFEYLKSLCRVHGLKGVSPFDTEIPNLSNLSPSLVAKLIRDANIRLINECNGVLANLMPFRGLEPDSGTVFETAYATAIGKPVIGYTNDASLHEQRVISECGVVRKESAAFDGKWGFMIEEFGLKQNLMLSCSYDIKNSLEEAVESLATILHSSSRVSGDKCEANIEFLSR